MAQTLIKRFNQISKEDTKLAGGKGASLGEMTQAGIPVPEGFVILSSVFDQVIGKNNLNIEIEDILDKVNSKKGHTLETASRKIQEMILSTEMSEDIQTEILESYKNLNCTFVAVRSSATSEDSASAAWAGQLDSFLNTNELTLLENVKKCWASLFTPRAILYRFEQKLNKDKISISVVVQKMVDSEESGIAFSVHPITQDVNQIIIEAGFGLGEAIVSGSITPDDYVVDKSKVKILGININEQNKALYKKDKGGNEWKELGEKGKKQVLTEKEIIELAKLIIKIEKHYGFPCDIEWAREKGRFYILQSRPITTLNRKNAESVRKELEEIKIINKRGPLELVVSYPPQNVLLLEYMCSFSYSRDNPAYAIMNYKPGQTAVILQEKQFEVWTNPKDKPLIKDQKKIGIIDRNSREFCSYAKKELKKVIDITDSELSSSTKFIQTLDQVNKLNRKVYWYFTLYIEECFVTRNEKLIYQLQKTRMLFDDLTSKYLWKTFDRLIEVLINVYKIPEEMTKWATTKEVVDLVRNPSHLNMYHSIIDRPIAWIIINGEPTTVIGEKVKKIREYLHRQDPFKIKEKQSLSENLIKGFIGNKGYAIGEIQKILPEDFGNKNKLKELLNKDNYILVTSMTIPEAVIYFKNAKAFITDEGGITCHAAIIAREMGIPCVIGTKIATRVLDNGDKVEVDANHGVIKILKRAKR